MVKMHLKYLFTKKLRCSIRIPVIGFFCFILVLPGCGYLDERREITRSKKVLAQGTKETEDLVKVRGRLKRIIDLKVQAVDILEDVDRELGRKYMALGSYKLASEVFLEAESLLPYNGFIKKDLGECYYFLGAGAVDADEKNTYLIKSKAYYEKALEINPDIFEARYGLGLLLFFGFNDVIAAIDQMKVVLAGEPDNADAHFALGRFYYETGELGKSMGEYLELQKILPASSPKRDKVDENILKLNRELGVEQ